MTRPQIDLVTVIGWGLLLMPLLTMWHEIGGHAATCVALGGHVSTLGAFYVDCEGLSGWRNIAVACAGVIVNAGLALAAYALWRRAHGAKRLGLYYVWVGEAFVAAGYFLFSGFSGMGDLGTGDGGALQGLAMPGTIRIAEIAFGLASYILLVRAAIRALNTMIGTGPESKAARRRIGHGYYVTAGIGAVIVGLLNPVGMAITIMSAAASSFGGLAGFISIGFASQKEGVALPFEIGRSWLLLALGVVTILAFALIFGPSQSFPA